MIELFVASFVLTLARVGTFVHFAPLLGGPNTPRTVKLGLTFAVSIVLFETNASTILVDVAATTSGSMSWLRFGLALGREAILGGLLGSAFALFLVPARVAGDFIAQESGLTFGSVVTAGGDSSSNPLSAFFEMVAAMIFFLLDLHHVFLLVLRESITLYPLGRAFALPNFDYVTAVCAVSDGGIALAAPVAVCLFVTTVVLAVMTRAAPQMNIYSVGFPLRVIVSMAAMTFLLPQFISGVVGMFSLLLEILRLRG